MVFWGLAVPMFASVRPFLRLVTLQKNISEKNPIQTLADSRNGGIFVPSNDSNKQHSTFNIQHSRP